MLDDEAKALLLQPFVPWSCTAVRELAQRLDTIQDTLDHRHCLAWRVFRDLIIDLGQVVFGTPKNSNRVGH